VDTLRLVVNQAGGNDESNDGEENKQEKRNKNVEEVSKKLRGGMARDKFGDKDVNEDVYFDCNVLDKLDKNGVAEGDANAEDQNIDLMDFISKSDFSTVGG